MPLKHDHPQYGGYTSPLLQMLQERWPGFHPLREMEKMLNDPKTPPKVKKSLRKDLAAYTVLRVNP